MSDVRPFEKYKEMIKDMRKEEMIRGLYDLSARVTKQENIIKEVREYIEKYDFITGYYEHNYDDENDTYTHYTVKEELLEILDKNKLGI